MKRRRQRLTGFQSPDQIRPSARSTVGARTVRQPGAALCGALVVSLACGTRTSDPAPDVSSTQVAPRPPAETRAIPKLGPPPIEKARFSNRMSPAGISLFYGATTAEVALAETFVRKDDKPAVATVGEFELTRDLWLVNLVDLPSIPDLLDAEHRWQRDGLIFLHAFREDFVKPVIKDGREHVEYVPSQIVTEYFRYRFRYEGSMQVQGVLYPSARSPEGVACVLFVSYEDCADDWEFGEPTPPPFQLVGCSEHPISD